MQPIYGDVWVPDATTSAAADTTVSDKLKQAAANNPALQQNISDYQAVSGVDKDISSAFKDATGKDIDAASARKYQDMLNFGMSLDQIKYNINTSQPALLKQGDVGALKGSSLAYNPANFSVPAIPTINQYGSYSAPLPASTYNYGNVSAIPTYGQNNLGGYGGGYGVPDYAGAGQFGVQQYQQSQQPRQATGKGASTQPTYQQSQQATGKGAAPAQQQNAQYYNAPGWGGSGINPNLYAAQQPTYQPPAQATGKGASTQEIGRAHV